VCNFNIIHLSIFHWLFWKVDPCVFEKISKQFNKKQDNILNNIQKRAIKRFIYSIRHTIITDRKTRTHNHQGNLEDHHEKIYCKTKLYKNKKTKCYCSICGGSLLKRCCNTVSEESQTPTTRY